MIITSNQNNLSFTGVRILEKPKNTIFCIEVFPDTFEGIQYKKGKKTLSSVAKELTEMCKKSELCTCSPSRLQEKFKQIVADSPMSKQQKKIATTLIDTVHNSGKTPTMQVAEMEVEKAGQKSKVRGISFNYEI